MTNNNLDELVVEVRASTAGFANDIAQMRGSLDTDLLSGFEKAGSVFEKGLLSAIRKGSLGFDDLKRIASSTLEEIASQALQMGLDQLFGGGGKGGSGGGGSDLGSALGSLAASFLGLPGRATGGPVAPGRGFLVGERGPEVFVPTSAGRVETLSGGGGAGRDVRVSIQIAEGRGMSTPRAMERSSRQVASAVRRALSQA